MNEPKPGLCDKLIGRLEESLGAINGAVSDQLQQPAYNGLGHGYDMDQSGQIFDPASLQQMILPAGSQEQMGLLQ
mgnify:CR=1 FL=1